MLSHGNAKHRAGVDSIQFESASHSLAWLEHLGGCCGTCGLSVLSIALKQFISDSCLQAFFVLVDIAGNQMPQPVVATATTNPDNQAPVIQMRLNSGVDEQVSCPDGSGHKVCGALGTHNVSLYFDVDEAGAVYYVFTKLPASAQCDCDALKIAPGTMYEIPEDQLWSGCKPAPKARRRQLLDTHGSLASRAHACDGVSEFGSTLVGSDAKNTWWTEPSLRSMLQDVDSSVSNVCLVNRQCECCTPNRNCHLDFSGVWSTRADMRAAGTRLMSACAYMKASKLIRMPISDVWAMAALADSLVISQSMESLGPAVGAKPNSALTLSSSVGFEQRSTATRAETPYQEGNATLPSQAVAEEFVDAPSNLGHVSRSPIGRLLAAVENLAVMAVEPGMSPGNSSSTSYRQPAYAAAGRQQLEPDSFYALFAVTEDQITPTPNMPSIARQWIMRTQSVAPPSCDVECLEQSSTPTSIEFRVKLNTTGRVFYVVQEEDSHATPTVQNVRSWYW
jgi:hypothetical protein